MTSFFFLPLSLHYFYYYKFTISCCSMLLIFLYCFCNNIHSLVSTTIKLFIAWYCFLCPQVLQRKKCHTTYSIISWDVGYTLRMMDHPKKIKSVQLNFDFPYTLFHYYNLLTWDDCDGGKKWKRSFRRAIFCFVYVLP